MLKGKINNGINGKLFRYLQELHSNGLEPIYEKPDYNLNEITALALEAAYIEHYGLNCLCNYQSSGFGGMNSSDEMRLKIGYRTSVQQHGYKGTFEKYKLDKDIKLLNEIINDIRTERLNAWHLLFVPLHKLGVQMKEDKRKALKEEEEQNLYEQRLIVSMDDKTKTYVRLCPSCKNKIVNHHRNGFLQSADLKRVCMSCRNKKIKKIHLTPENRIKFLKQMEPFRKTRWNNITAEERDRLSRNAKDRWNSLPPEEQERIRQIGRENGPKSINCVKR
jgi:hypothetical protein